MVSKQEEMIDAADQGRIEDVKSLLNDESVDINEKDRSPGSTALHWASYKGHRDVVELLLENGADIEARRSNWLNCTPLIIGYHYGHKSIVELLLDRGADIHAINKNSADALYTACANGNGGVVKLLLKHGANVNSCTVNKWTPLHSACSNGHVKCVETLLCHGAEVDVKNDINEKTTLLAFARQN